MHASVVFILILIRRSLQSDWIKVSQNSKSVGDSSLAIDRSLLVSDMNFITGFHEAGHESLGQIFTRDLQTEILQNLRYHNHKTNNTSNNNSINKSFNQNRSLKKPDNSTILNQLKSSHEFITDYHKSNIAKNSVPNIFSKQHDLSSFPLLQSPDDTFSFESKSIYLSPSKENKQNSLKSVKEPAERINDKIARNVIVNQTKQKFDFAAILTFLTHFQKIFSINAIHNARDKVEYLKNFKDKILIYIEDRLMELWMPKHNDKQNKSRMKRTAMMMHSGGHGFEIPSSEIALLTISFLTLAVFLIKLVLQIIHTIKSKHYAVSMVQSQTADSPIKIIQTNSNVRRLSSNDIQTVTSVLSSIEKLNTT